MLELELGVAEFGLMEFDAVSKLICVVASDPWPTGGNVDVIFYSFYELYLKKNSLVKKKRVS